MTVAARSLCALAICLAGNVPTIATAQETPTRSLRFFLQEPPWALLARPTTGWELGDVVTTNSIANGDPQIVGNVAKDCLPKEAWETRDRTGPQLEFAGTYKYGMDWAVAWKKYGFNLSAYAELLHASKRTLVLRDYKELVVVSGATSRWLNAKSKSGEKNLNSRSKECIQWLTIPDAFVIVGGIFLVKDGDFKVTPSNGAKIGANAQQPLTGAAGKAVINVSEEEQNTMVVRSGQPIAIALRPATLIDYGNRPSKATGNGDETRNSFNKLMRDGGLVAEDDQ